jgi:carbon storage regulator
MEVLAMLVLTRRTNERIVIDEEIVVTIVRVAGQRVRVGIEAPPHVRIVREELHGAVGDRLAQRAQPAA